MYELDYWEKISNTCLKKTSELLEKGTVPSMQNLAIVRKLIEIAIAIDHANLQWVKQNRYGEVLRRNPRVEQKSSKNSIETVKDQGKVN